MESYLEYFKIYMLTYSGNLLNPIFFYKEKVSRWLKNDKPSIYII